VKFPRVTRLQASRRKRQRHNNNEIFAAKDKEKMNTHRTNGTFAFAPIHETVPSAKSKEPFFCQRTKKNMYFAFKIFDRK